MFAAKGSHALHKLQLDVARFCGDHSVSGRIALVKLLIVVDFWPVLYYRLCEYSHECEALTRRILEMLLLPFKPVVEGISGARIYEGSQIGGGLLLHQSSGVVIAPGAEIGENCTFFSGACVVCSTEGGSYVSPKIGNNVRLTVGCKVIGAVTIGDNVTVGANAVVITDVADHSVVAGIPAQQIMPRKQAIND